MIYAAPVMGSLRRAARAAALLSSLALASFASAESLPATELPPSTASDPLFDETFDAELDPGIRDPIEPMNRRVFSVNRAIERGLLDPVTRAYGALVPGPVKRAVRNVFDNLNLPVVIANDLLQLEPRRAASATARFLLNSTFGIGGIFDPALEGGFAAHQADFGQTLGKAGIGPGLYLVLPLMGPSTARDAFGSLVDMALRPDTWILPLAPRMLLGGTWGITEREQHMASLEALEQSSLDYYVAIRSAYWMSREAFVRDEGPGTAPAPIAPPVSARNDPAPP